MHFMVKGLGGIIVSYELNLEWNDTFLIGLHLYEKYACRREYIEGDITVKRGIQTCLLSTGNDSVAAETNIAR